MDGACIEESCSALFRVVQFCTIAVIYLGIATLLHWIRGKLRRQMIFNFQLLFIFCKEIFEEN